MLVEENSRDFHELYDNEAMCIPGGTAPLKNLFSQYYSIFRVNELRKEHERDHGMQYDVVMKWRPDLQMQDPAPRDEFQRCIDDPLLLFTPDSHRSTLTFEYGCLRCESGFHTGPHEGDISDLFAFGSGKAMDRYCGVLYQAVDVYREIAREYHNDELLANGFPIVRQEGPLTITRKRDIYKIGGFFPERILAYHLQGFRVIHSSLHTKTLKFRPPESVIDWLRFEPILFQYPKFQVPRFLLPIVRPVVTSLIRRVYLPIFLPRPTRTMRLQNV